MKFTHTTMATFTLMGVLQCPKCDILQKDMSAEVCPSAWPHVVPENWQEFHVK